MKRGSMFLLVLAITASSNRALADGDCKTPPEFVGVPTGVAALKLGEEVDKGHEAFFNFGDTFVVAGDFNGLFAATLWGLDDCGLWIQIGEHESYLDPKRPPRPAPPTYVVIEAEKGVYVITSELLREHSDRVQVLDLALRPFSGPVFELKQLYPDRFQLRVLVDLPFVHSDL